MLQGRYGVEFDDQESSPVKKLVWLVWLIPAAVLAFFLFRGCGTEDATPASMAKENPAEARRYDAPETKRPGFFSHLFHRERKAETAEKPAVPVVTSAAGSAALDGAGVAKASPELRRLLELAVKKENEDDLLGARLVLRDALANPGVGDARPFVERRIADLNATLLFSDREMPEKKQYVIAAGDLISKLSRKFGNTQAFILKANGIDNPSQLRIGRKIWVLNEPSFVLAVDRKGFSAVLTLNGQFFKRYSVGIGPADSVPAGTYSLRSRVEHPVYRRPGELTIPYGGEGNILGAWWLSLSPIGGDDTDVNGLGLHGTANDALLGRATDDGYIRFSNADISDLALLLPSGTRVVVR
jgi:LysM repeat protein